MGVAYSKCLLGASAFSFFAQRENGVRRQILTDILRCKANLRYVPAVAPEDRLWWSGGAGFAEVQLVCSCNLLRGHQTSIGEMFEDVGR